jgi:acetylornithine deacetylase/succinyl-diaminopimelate desuccinylase-like protein
MFITRGIPAVCGYGVACGNVHGADEWVDLESLGIVTKVYAQTILRFLSEGKDT